MMFPFPPHEYVLLLLDGEKPELQFFKKFHQAAFSCIAVDGAATWALEHHISPDLVIGDLDSFTRKDSQLPLMEISEQESNDFEKALRYVIDKGHKNILVMGAFGLRADHLLSNFFVLSRYASRATIILLDEQQVAFMCPPAKEICITHKQGAYLSLFPLGNKIGPIKTKGLAYPLDEELLSLDERIGTLNKIIHEQICIRSKSAGLLAFVPYHENFNIKEN